MHATNFTWHDSIHIQLNGEYFDLHNNFDFQQFTYSPKRQLLVLDWKRGSEDWIPQGQPKKIAMRIRGVTEFTFRERDPEMPFSEDDCLASFGYDCDKDWTDGQFWTDEVPENDWRWSFIFQSGAEIQVAGETATIDISSE